jgi:GntR family transcriptional regulator, trigonelline degradation regulator
MEYQLQRVETSAAPVREMVLRSIRRAIVHGWYQPGQRLIEREICELTGVSRTSVREALRQLESEGLVELIPNRGPIVARMTVRDATELYQVRQALESLAGRLAATNAREDHLAAMAAAIDELETAIDAGDLNAVLAQKDHFYDALFVCADNSALVKSITSLHGRIMLLRSQSLGREGRPREMLVELREIVAAIAAGDATAAEAACSRHVARAAEVAIGALDGAATAEGTDLVDGG